MQLNGKSPYEGIKNKNHVTVITYKAIGVLLAKSLLSGPKMLPQPCGGQWIRHRRARPWPPITCVGAH